MIEMARKTTVVIFGMCDVSVSSRHAAWGVLEMLFGVCKGFSWVVRHVLAKHITKIDLQTCAIVAQIGRLRAFAIIRAQHRQITAAKDV